MRDGREEARSATGGSSGFTVRSFLLGSVCCLIIAIGTPFANMYIRGSTLALDFSTAAAVFLLFILVGILNVFIGLIRRSFALRRGELIVVYIMMIVATSIPTMGLTEYLLPILTGVFYYATPENQWADLIHPYIPDWIAPGRNAEAVKYFYEGLPKGMPIPWEAWAESLLYWLSFLIAFYFVMICMMVILRKQWVERERLIFPLIHAPLEMTREDEEGSRINPLFKNGMMWIGFAIPVIIGSIRALHGYYRFLPTLNLVTTLPIFRNTFTLRIALSFPMLGFSYFINTDIALGIWVFYLLTTIEQGIFNIVGISSDEILSIYGNPGSPYIAHQGMGAMIVMVAVGLWTARGHLRAVYRKAFRGDPTVDDSDEMLSYRTALLGTIAGLLFMGIWMWRSGLPGATVPLFLLAAFVVFIGLTRIVSEGGVAAARSPMIASGFVVSGVGSSALGPAGMVSLGMTYIWAADIRTFVMASCANGLKLAQELTGKRKKLFWAMMAAVVLGLGGSIWIIGALAYTYGGINLQQWFFVGGPQAPFNYVGPKILAPTQAELGGWLFTAIGAGIMALLLIVRHRFLWWPLHPLGFPISAESFMMGYIWFSVFLAWLIKVVILKYGGPRTYRSTRPFFIGAILGQFVVAGAWLIIDYFTGMTDNGIYWV